jgi:hypothetical protein
MLKRFRDSVLLLQALYFCKPCDWELVRPKSA